jgi:hypothetical protein
MIDKVYLKETCLIFLIFPLLIRCQCETDWFGRNCSEPSLCNSNNTNFCPDGFICKTTDENQECKFNFLLEISKIRFLIKRFSNSNI